MRGDLTNPKVLYLKAALFIAGGTIAAALVVLEKPSLRISVLLALTVWCFARAYYFAFYVIEHYVDPGFRFAGLGSFVRYAWARQRRDATAEAKPAAPR